MNNDLPDFGQNNWQSPLNDFLQSLGIDTPETQPHSDPNLPHNHLTDYSPQHNAIEPPIDQPGMLPDFSQTAWNDLPQQYHLPDQHHDWNQTPGVDQHHLNQHQWHDHELQAMHYSYSSYAVSGTDDTIKGPHIDIRDSGHIYLHQLNGETVDVGHVDGHVMYNSSGWEVGYFKDNGDVYKYNYSSSDHCIGKVENGHIYNTDHKEIGLADTNLEGAAHLLFAVGGGAKT
jgi:hypothetical protein